MYTTPLPRPSAAAARRRHGARCPARRASPTACCCSPAWRRHDACRTTCSTPTTRGSCSTRCAQLGCARRGATAPARASPASAAGCSAARRDLFLGNAGTAMRPLDRRAGAAGGDAGRPLRAARRAAHARAADRRPGRRAARGSAARSTTSAATAIRRCACAAAPARSHLDAPIRVRGDVSSQFLTALLLALPLVSAGARRRRSRSTAS